MDYESEKKALASLSDQRINFIRKHCPVFQSRCKGFDCHSFFGGKAFQSNSDKNLWLTMEPGCTCSTVTGIIEVVD